MEDKTPPLVVSVTHWIHAWPNTKSMKTGYFLKDSVNMMLVTCIIVLNMKSKYLP